MLKAYSRLLEQLILVVDLVLVGLCWLLAYWLRFYVAGPPLPYGDTPPLADYLLMLLPILLVWSVSFRAFGLYRPRRIGSHLSEAIDIAKASTMGVLVLVAVMTFFFRGYDYSRVVIVYFGLLSIGVVWFSRAAFREVLRFARRRGYNQRFAVVVGDGELAATVVQRIHGRSDVGIQVLGVVGDDKDDTGGARRLGGYADLRAVLDAHQADHVILALAHEDYGRLAGLLDAVGDEPVTIHVVPDLLRFASAARGHRAVRGHAVHPPAGVAALRVEPAGQARVRLRLLGRRARRASGRCSPARRSAVKLELPRARVLPPGAHGPGRASASRCSSSARWTRTRRRRPGRSGRPADQRRTDSARSCGA